MTTTTATNPVRDAAQDVAGRNQHKLPVWIAIVLAAVIVAGTLLWVFVSSGSSSTTAPPREPAVTHVQKIGVSDFGTAGAAAPACDPAPRTNFC